MNDRGIKIYNHKTIVINTFLRSFEAFLKFNIFMHSASILLFENYIHAYMFEVFMHSVFYAKT